MIQSEKCKTRNNRTNCEVRKLKLKPERWGEREREEEDEEERR